MFTLCTKMECANDLLRRLADCAIAPVLLCFEITRNNTAMLTHINKALYIDGASDLVAHTPLGPTDVTLLCNLPAGYIHDVRAVAVKATGTFATAIVRLA